MMQLQTRRYLENYWNGISGLLKLVVCRMLFIWTFYWFILDSVISEAAIKLLCAHFERALNYNVTICKFISVFVLTVDVVTGNFFTGSFSWQLDLERLQIVDSKGNIFQALQGSQKCANFIPCQG
jgi:hypothetical protein